MIHIEHVGNKPVISSRGIIFSGKKDKFEFIEPAAYVLNILINFNGSKKIEKITPAKKLSEKDILNILYNALPGFNKLYKKQIHEYTTSLHEKEKKTIRTNHLNEIEQRTLKNNFTHMQNYLIQRATNKLVYEEMINFSVKLIREKGIRNLQVPFSMNFIHVLESLQTTMQRGRALLETTLEVKLEQKNPYAELIII